MTRKDGSAEMWLHETEDVDARRWARCFGKDARLCFIRSHIHRCMNTCWKYSGGGKDGDYVRVCRFNFNHEYHVLIQARRPPAKKCKAGDSCCLRLVVHRGCAHEGGCGDVTIVPAFDAASEFQGARSGMYFGRGPCGLGYYGDLKGSPELAPTMSSDDPRYQISPFRVHP